MAKDLSQLNRIYLALWKKAYEEKDLGLKPITINASNFSVATSMRVGLYRAIRPYRNREAFNSVLEAAAEYIVPTLAKPEDNSDPCVITFLPRKSLSELELQLQSLGIGEADLQTPEEKQINEDLKLLAEKPEVRKSNPFFKRED